MDKRTDNFGKVVQFKMKIVAFATGDFLHISVESFPKNLSNQELIPVYIFSSTFFSEVIKLEETNPTEFNEMMEKEESMYIFASHYTRYFV